MSTSLYWREPPRNPKGHEFGYQLKWSLSGRFFDHDGSLSTDWFKVTKADIPFLEGVEAAGNDETKREAQKLIKLIEKWGAVELKLAG